MVNKRMEKGWRLGSTKLTKTILFILLSFILYRYFNIELIFELSITIRRITNKKKEGINTVIDTNVKGVLFILRAIVPSMIERKAGHIINISSVAGLQAYRGGSVYCASKHAVQAISNTLRKEVNQFGLKVSSICPGLVSETEFSVVRLGSEDKAKEVYKGYDPLVPDDIADNVLYCASRFVFFIHSFDLIQ